MLFSDLMFVIMRREIVKMESLSYGNSGFVKSILIVILVEGVRMFIGVCLEIVDRSWTCQDYYNVRFINQTNY